MKSVNGWRLASAAILLLSPMLAHAGVIVTIDDRELGPVNPVVTIAGFDPTTVNQQVNPEAFDLHGEYLSTMLIPNGTSISVNFDFLELLGGPETGLISDTLNIVFTGHTPVTGDVNNLSVDMHFRSDTDPFGLPGLSNAITITETGNFQSLTNMIQQAGGPSDFGISVASGAVPEPSAFNLMCIGGIAILLGRLRSGRTAK